MADLRIGRRKAALFALTALGLALVVWAFAALSTPKQQPPEKKSAAIEAQKLADAAEKAASSAQTESALALANSALKTDPKNQTALRVKSTLTQTPADADGGSTPAEPVAKPQPDSRFTKATAEMATLLPTSFKGWSRGHVVSEKMTALCTFEPPMTDPASDMVIRISMYARDGGSAAAAAKSLLASKRAYPANAASLRLPAADAYFGTDDWQLADVGFVRGRYSFEVIVTTVPGVQPVMAKKLAQEAANAMPAAK